MCLGVADLGTVITLSSELRLVCWQETRRTEPANKTNQLIKNKKFGVTFQTLKAEKASRTFFSSRMSLKRMRTCEGEIKKVYWRCYKTRHQRLYSSLCFLPCAESAELNPSETNLSTETRASTNEESFDLFVQTWCFFTQKRKETECKTFAEFTRRPK